MKVEIPIELAEALLGITKFCISMHGLDHDHKAYDLLHEAILKAKQDKKKQGKRNK